MMVLVDGVLGLGVGVVLPGVVVVVLTVGAAKAGRGFSLVTEIRPTTHMKRLSPKVTQV